MSCQASTLDNLCIHTPYPEWKLYEVAWHVDANDFDWLHAADLLAVFKPSEVVNLIIDGDFIDIHRAFEFSFLVSCGRLGREVRALWYTVFGIPEVGGHST